MDHDLLDELVQEVCDARCGHRWSYERAIHGRLKYICHSSLGVDCTIFQF
jgi:hypothetical protein